jgi:hypothetical protein
MPNFITTFSVGRTLPLPIPDGATISGQTNEWDNIFTRHEFTGSNGTTSTLIIHPVATYLVTDQYNNSVYHDIYAVNVTPCPVSSDCDVPGHSALMLVRRGWGSGTYAVYDLPSVLINGGFANVPLLNDATLNNEARGSIINAVERTFTSFQWNHDVTDNWPYALTVFEGIILQQPGEYGNISYLNVPYNKRLITTGDSLEVRSGDIGDRVQLTFSVGVTPTAAANYPAALAESFTDTTVTDVTPTAEPGEINSEIGRLNLTIEHLQSIIDTARSTASQYTKDNGGCDEGKMRFLRDMGLWPDADDEEIAELAGIEYERDYSVTLSLSFDISTELTLRPSTAEDIGVYDITDYVDIDELLRQHLRYAEVSIDDLSIEEA